MIAAALQYTARSDIKTNCDIANMLIEQAVKEGANFICLPECANLLARDKQTLFQLAETETNSAFLKQMCASAAKHQLWISVGSAMLQSDDETDDRIANRHLIINPEGEITARYDKIHMFDAKVGDGKTYLESASFKAGQTPVLASIDGHKTGLSICYDVRFAGLYHHYADQQAEMLLIPAAFTRTTGQAHWHILQRSRAIETGAFVIAAAQKGQHDDGRQTYGHALIISPWGEILADAGADGDMAIAEIDFNEVTKARAALTAWCNQRRF